MKVLEAKLEHTTRNQRFYRLSEPLKVGKRFGKDVDIVAELADVGKTRLKQEYVKYINPKGAEVICISDADTHTERLVFAAAHFGSIGYGRTSVRIDGSLTMMIHGGDSQAIYPDEVYLRHLAKINGFNSINIV